MSVAGGRITAGVGANLIGQHAQDRNQDATVYVGNLDPQVGMILQAKDSDGSVSMIWGQPRWLLYI